MSSRLDTFVDDQLKFWAIWSIGIQSGDIGYPSQSSAARLFEPRDKMQYITQKRHPVENEAAEEVDKILSDLGSDYPELASVLEEYYLNPDKKNAAQAVASKHHISTRTCWEWIRCAKMYVAKGLSHKCKEGMYEKIF